MCQVEHNLYRAGADVEQYDQPVFICITGADIVNSCRWFMKYAGY